VFDCYKIAGKIATPRLRNNYMTLPSFILAEAFEQA